MRRRRKKKADDGQQDLFGLPPNPPPPPPPPDPRDNPAASAQARDEAIDRVNEHADEEWKDRAISAVRKLAQTRLPFTTDDVWLGLGQGDTPREPRAMGAVMRQCAAIGIVKPLPGWRNSSLIDCHRRPKRLWIGI